MRWIWKDQAEENQPIAGVQRALIVYVTGLLPEPPRRVIRVRGRHRGPVHALSGIHTPRECVWWMWNDQTGGTNRFLMCTADWSSIYVTSLLCQSLRDVLLRLWAATEDPSVH
jgi:hypothetical protein